MVTNSNYTNHGKHFVMFINVESLYCTPKTIIIMSTILQEKKYYYEYFMNVNG